MRFKTAKKLWKAINEGHRAKPLTVIDGWVAADYLAGFNIAGNATLSCGYGSIAYSAVTSDANLPGEDDAFADGGGTGETNLSTEEGIPSDSGSMPYLYEIVDFGPGMNAGFSDGGTIDAGVGLDFNGILEDCWARLKDLVPGPIGLTGESEPVCADDGAVLKDNIVSKLAVLANYRVGVRKKIVSDRDIGVEN